VDAADVLISGFTNPKQAVFEVTVTPSVEDSKQNVDVFNSTELKIFEQPMKEEKSCNKRDLQPDSKAIKWSIGI
jgi:hypothetical protein